MDTYRKMLMDGCVCGDLFVESLAYVNDELDPDHLMCEDCSYSWCESCNTRTRALWWVQDLENDDSVGACEDCVKYVRRDFLGDNWDTHRHTGPCGYGDDGDDEFCEEIRPQMRNPEEVGYWPLPVPSRPAALVEAQEEFRSVVKVALDEAMRAFGGR